MQLLRSLEWGSFGWTDLGGVSSEEAEIRARREGCPPVRVVLTRGERRRSVGLHPRASDPVSRPPIIP